MIKLMDKLLEGECFIVTSHCNPDGDSIGSLTGLCMALRRLKKKAFVVMDDAVPANLEFLMRLSGASVLEGALPEKYSLIALDCGDAKRLCCSEAVKEGAESIINIDHHVSNDCFGDVNYVDKEASSTSEIVYYILKQISKEKKTELVDSAIASCLYTGLITDTGNFMYSNAGADSFKMACEIMKIGIDKDSIVKNLFQSNSYSRMKLLGDALETLSLHGDSIASIELTQEMFQRHGVDSNSTEGIIDYARDIENVEIAVLFKEKSKDDIKVSLRSKEYADVNAIAQKFGGGGHVRAAGCTISDTIENAKLLVIAELKKALKL
ncbi:DHH family phosphoesterase [Peptoclostridium acidaminophilum]|nr:bifunctional oligoribonuclease/PAP phosphatase NrnA [Peptoclostridium acidaminophilum]